MNPMAQVAHAKSQLSAVGEYVPTPREFERILRDVGCSQMVAKRMMSKIFEGEDLSRDVPEAPREVEAAKDESEAPREVEVELDDDDIARAANAIAESMFASTIKVPRI